MPETGRPRRVARFVLWAATLAYAVEAIELRRRAARVDVLPASGSAPPPGGADPAPEVVVVALSGSRVDAGTRWAAAGEMGVDGIQALDLVPADLPADRALRLLRRIEPRRLESDPLYAPGGAHEAVVLHRSVVDRMGRPADIAPERASLARLTVRAQRHAPGATALRVAPGLRAAAQSPSDRWRELEELTSFGRPLYALAPLLVSLRAAHLVGLAVGVMAAPGAGLAALVAWSAQPALVFGRRGGTPRLTPPSLIGASVGRWPSAGADVVRTAVAGWRDSRAGSRSPRVSASAPSAGERFEAPSATCTWCGSASLRGRLDTVDLFQHKPGEFHLDQCDACGHIFQNPQLTTAGLDYYYEQFYDGASEELTEVSFAAMARVYHRRADVLARFTEPRACLDVGTGHAHFCLVARRRWPKATFDGLDLSESVEEAQRRGWVDTAYRGAFPDLAGRLPRAYDVVTMHHYLEHTREPRRELAAAATVLEPGGYLVVEVPDAASPWARRLGRFWYSWLQPQHLHFVTCDNLVSALEDGGFEVVSVERGPANLGGDLFTAVVLAMQRCAPSSHAPWLPPPSAVRRAWRVAVIGMAAPLLALAAVPDLMMDVRLRRPGTDTPGNALRVVARRS